MIVLRTRNLSNLNKNINDNPNDNEFFIAHEFTQINTNLRR